MPRRIPTHATLTSLAISVLASLLPLAAVACGQDAPTCATDCALVGEGSHTNVLTTNPASASTVTYDSCPDACAADETTATNAGSGPRFQQLLTCIGNAGAFSTSCEQLACGLTTAFGTPSSCAASSDAGGACVRDCEAACDGDAACTAECEHDCPS